MQVFIYKYKFWICAGIFVNRGKLMVMIIQSAFSHHMFDNTVHLLWLCLNSRFFMVFTGSVPWGGYSYWVDFKVFYVCMIPIEPVFLSQLAITWFVASEMNQVPCVSTNMILSWVGLLFLSFFYFDIMHSCVSSCLSVSPVCFSLSVFFHSLPYLSFSFLTPLVPLVSVSVYIFFVLHHVFVSLFSDVPCYSVLVCLPPCCYPALCRSVSSCLPFNMFLIFGFLFLVWFNSLLFCCTLSKLFLIATLFLVLVTHFWFV